MINTDLSMMGWCRKGKVDCHLHGTKATGSLSVCLKCTNGKLASLKTLHAVVPGGASAGTSGATFSLARDPNETRGRIGANPGHSRLVPGAAPPDTKTASKNAKRRQRAKVTHLLLFV